METVLYIGLLLAVSGFLAYIILLKLHHKKRYRKETVFLRDITPKTRGVRAFGADVI